MAYRSGRRIFYEPMEPTFLAITFRLDSRCGGGGRHLLDVRSELQQSSVVRLGMCQMPAPFPEADSRCSVRFARNRLP